MAEEEKKKGIVSRFFPAKDTFKRFLRNVLKLPVHSTPTPGIDISETFVYKNIEKLIDYRVVKQLNEEMIKTERTWDGSPGEHLENVDLIRKEILEIYTKNGDEVSDSLGPFTDNMSLIDEGTWAEKGTGTEEETITINKGGKQITGKFSIPAKKPLIYMDGRGGKNSDGTDNFIAYQVAFFGSENQRYWENLKREIEKICSDVEKNEMSTHNDPEIRKNIHQNVDSIRRITIGMINAIRAFTHELENKHRASLTGAGGVKKHYNVLDNLKSKLFKLKLTDEQVHYTHTYKIIRPVFYDRKKGKIRKLKEEVSGFKLPEEVDHGLDEHGWPLEVGDGETSFEGNRLKKGEVLLDIYKNRPNVRVVPNDFITECDLLDMAVWIYVHYDSYRDDLRDARYHKNAITVIERIMADLDVKMDSENIKRIKNNEHARPKIKLNKLPGVNPGRPATDPDSVEMTIKTSNLLPAFDSRAKFFTKHRGRMYYYETQADQQDRYQSDEPTITTRGAAMYILHRVIEETKYWGGTGDPAKAGVLEILQKIGEQTNGFDIGPNMGEGETGWGKQLTKNPFKPFRG